MPEPSLAYRAAPCADASGRPPDACPLVWSRPSSKLVRCPSTWARWGSRLRDSRQTVSLFPLMLSWLPGARPFQPLPSAPLSLLHEQTYSLSEQLAHGKVVLFHHPPRLRFHFRGQGEGDGLELPGGGHSFISFNSGMSYYTLSKRRLSAPSARNHGQGQWDLGAATVVPSRPVRAAR